MRKIILFIASSLDGYIARESGEIDWLFTDQDYGYIDFLSQIDTLIIGRKTYEQILNFGDYPYHEQQVFVFSTTQEGITDNNAKYINRDWQAFVDGLRQSEGRDIWLVGGGKLINFFLQHRFIDELILAVHPIILGGGIPLILQDASVETKLKLKDVKVFDTGLVQLFYDFPSGR